MPGSAHVAVIPTASAGSWRRLVAAAPADLVAIDRLAQLAEKDGQPARAAELENKKAEIERARSSLL